MTTQEVELSKMENVDGASQDSPVLEVNCIVSNEVDANKSSPNVVGKDVSQTNSEETEPEQNGENVKNGAHNPVFMEDEGTIEETQPGLTYVDFLPQKSHPDILSVPTFSCFR